MTTATAAPSASATPSALIRCGRFFFKFRNYLFPLVFCPLAAATRPRTPFVGPDAELALLVLGLAVVCAGQGLRALVIGLVYIVRGGRNKQIYAEDLVQTGIFAHCRNPLYVGNVLIVAGLVLVHGGPWMYAVALPFWIFVYVAIVAAEESYLRGHFGSQYDDYCRRVPRFRLRLAGIGTTIRGMSFHWKRVVLKEYGTFYSTATAVLGLLAWKQVTYHGLEASRARLLGLGALFAVATVAYVTARILKKTRTLVDKPARTQPEATP